MAGRYDLFNRISSFGLDQGWRRRTLAALKLLPGMRMLDLATGTGDLAAIGARELVPVGRVVACDLSLSMLRLAQKKFQRHPVTCWHIQCAQVRAEALPFADRSFHAATIGFALRNVSDLELTMKELHRVVRPGGRVGLLEFGRPKNPLLRLGQHLWLLTGVPLIGIVTTGTAWPFLYLRRSILQFISSDEVVLRLKTAGFTEAQAHPISGGVVVLYTALRSSN